MNIVGCRWVYRIKRKADGSIDRYKARLGAKGFNQQEGLDYDETFGSVVKSATIRTILSIAHSRDWPIKQLDIRNAFLNGFLFEEVYMAQAPGFIDPHKPTHVCHLYRALYGLKQSPRAWFYRLSKFLTRLGFFNSRTDGSLFIRHDSPSTLIILVYVDDLIITRSSPVIVSDFIDQLCATFDSCKLGDLGYFLGIEITQTTDQLHLIQTRYAVDLLTRFNMRDCKLCATPIAPYARLSLHSGDPLLDPTLYQSIVGGLQYLTLTRLDIAFAVNQICQFMHEPRSTHLQAAKRILRYVKGSLAKGLIFHKSPDLALWAYSDADWAGDPND